MELYQLKTFVTVADEGHLTRAAERLNSSQPTVSAHIKALEEELGLKLFLRTPKGMQLTNAGQLLKSKAEKALDMVNDLQKQAKKLKKETVGIVRIGLNIDPRFLKVKDLYPIAKKNYPGLELHMLQKTSWQVLDSVSNGELDAGFFYGENSKINTESLLLCRFNLMIAGPLEWKEKFETADWLHLSKFPWIWTPPQCIFHPISNELFQKHNLEPQKVVVSDQETTIQTLTSTGVGLTLMIEDEALLAEKEGILAVRKDSVATVDLSLAYRKKQEDDPAIQALLECIRKVWGFE